MAAWVVGDGYRNAADGNGAARAGAQPRDAERPSASGVEGQMASGAVGEFLRFARDPLAPHEAGVSHAYVIRGLRLLANALATAADQRGAADTVLARNLVLLRGRTDALEHGRRWSEHTRYAREAFLAAGDGLANLRRSAGDPVGGDVSAVWDAAMRVDVDLSLVQQVDRVGWCFTAAATALRDVGMDARASPTTNRPTGGRADEPASSGRSP
jgi:hypothetical protein